MRNAEKVWSNLETFGNPRQMARDAKRQAKSGRKAQKATLKRLGLKVVEVGILKRPRLVVEARNVRRALGR